MLPLAATLMEDYLIRDTQRPTAAQHANFSAKHMCAASIALQLCDPDPTLCPWVPRCCLLNLFCSLLNRSPSCRATFGHHRLAFANRPAAALELSGCLTHHHLFCRSGYASLHPYDQGKMSLRRVNCLTVRPFAPFAPTTRTNAHPY
jgi:hypothetical protein